MLHFVFGKVQNQARKLSKRNELILRNNRIFAQFVWLISHQPAVLLSQNKPATSNQPAVLFSQNKSAPAISHQPNEQAVYLF
jgi:hypothetical protein